MDNIWNFWADRYEKLWVQKYSLKPTRNLVIQELNKYFTPDMREIASLLDVGCGTGQLLEEIGRLLPYHNLSLTGIDSSEKMIAAANKKLGNVKVQVGDALNLSFADGQFDFLTCCHSFPHYRGKLQALGEFRRVLKPGGYLFLVQASENNVYDKTIMALVKLTTGQASYPSTVQIRELVASVGLITVEQIRLEGQFFMPSIILSILQKGDK